MHPGIASQRRPQTVILMIQTLLFSNIKLQIFSITDPTI